MTEAAGPLDGIRVVDLTTMITGPLCTMILADQGADVIKVEAPGLGDLLRYIGTSRGGLSAFFVTSNRNKRSVALDLKDERGYAALLRLVADADVVVQNFKPGVAARLRIDEAALRAVRPDLVYVSISGFGEHGPYASRPVYDNVIQGYSGVASTQSDPAVGAPILVRNAVCDKVTALTAAQAVTAALFARLRGRGGQHVRLAMIDATLAFLWPDAMMNHTFIGPDVDLRPPLAASYAVVPTKDGCITLTAVSDQQFHGFSRAIGHPEWVDDARLQTLPDRIANAEILRPALTGLFETKTTAEWLEALVPEGVPCAPMLTLDAVPDDPQVRHNGSVVESANPHAGAFREPRPAARFSATPAGLRRHAPSVGEHTREVFEEVGLPPEEVDALCARVAPAAVG